MDLSISKFFEFLKLVIEDDEVYTRLNGNAPADQSPAILLPDILLMERASRFIWRCGRKDERLFKKAVRILEKLVDKTQDLALLTNQAS